MSKGGGVIRIPEAWDKFVRCKHCGKESDIAKLPDDHFEYLKLPNTLNDLKDYQGVTWKCPHCGCFQP